MFYTFNLHVFSSTVFLRIPYLSKGWLVFFVGFLGLVFFCVC